MGLGDFLKEKVLPTAVGAGTGFLMGGPLGATAGGVLGSGVIGDILGDEEPGQPGYVPLGGGGGGPSKPYIDEELLSQMPELSLQNFSEARPGLWKDVSVGLSDAERNAKGMLQAELLQPGGQLNQALTGDPSLSFFRSNVIDPARRQHEQSKGQLRQSFGASPSGNMGRTGLGAIAESQQDAAFNAQVLEAEYQEIARQRQEKFQAYQAIPTVMNVLGLPRLQEMQNKMAQVDLWYKTNGFTKQEWEADMARIQSAMIMPSGGGGGGGYALAPQEESGGWMDALGGAFSGGVAGLMSTGTWAGAGMGAAAGGMGGYYGAGDTVAGASALITQAAPQIRAIGAGSGDGLQQYGTPKEGGK